MRFNEFSIVNEDIGLPIEKGTTKSWMAKSALGNPLDKLQDPADRAYQEKPAYQRAGKPEPITRPVPGTKPSVNLADPKQAAAYKAALDLEKPIINKAIGSVGTVSPAEPTMGVNNPETKIKSGVNPTVTRTEPTMGPSANPKPSNIPTLDPVKDAATATGKAATKSLGRRALGKVIPYYGSALDAEDAYNRYQIGDKSGAVISALGAAGGLVPGLGAPAAYGAMGLNAIKDMSGLTDKEIAAYQARQAQAAQQPQAELGYGPGKRAPITKTDYEQLAAQKGQPVPVKNTQTIPTAPAPRLTQQQMAAAQAAPNSGSTAQRSTYTTDQQAIKDRIASTQAQQNANNGIEQPKQLEPLKQPRQAYAGTAGAQAIQRANPDTIQDVNSIKAGSTINLPNNAGQYVIKPGDTLDKIAHNQLSAPTAQASSIATSIPNNSTDIPPIKKDESSVQAEEVNPLHRIKSLAGLK